MPDTSSTAIQLIEHVVTTLKAINGTGVYVTNLSMAADQVQVGEPPGDASVHVLPAMWVYDARVTTRRGNPLTTHTHDLEIRVRGFVRGTGTTLSALSAGWALAADVTHAIHATRGPTVTGATVHDVTVESADVVGGDLIGYTGLTLTEHLIRIEYRGRL